MKIIVENQREQQLIESMCDVVLRAGGIKNMAEVQLILNSIEKPQKKKESKDGKKQQ